MAPHPHRFVHALRHPLECMRVLRHLENPGYAIRPVNLTFLGAGGAAETERRHSALVFARLKSLEFSWRRVRTCSMYIRHSATRAANRTNSSYFAGIGSNAFVYQGVGELVYIRCFYFSFKTAAGIGKNARPTNELEYIFMATLWLEGRTSYNRFAS